MSVSIMMIYSLQPDYGHVRYLKKSRHRGDLYMFNTYFYSKLKEALSTLVWLLCFHAILIISKLRNTASIAFAPLDMHELA